MLDPKRTFGKQRLCLHKFSGKFAESLKDLGKSVEYINFKDGGQYFSIQHNRHVAFKAMNNFLTQHLNELQ
jgi:dipeptidyl aminopeptidase/acylaminoacyl peptidase